MNKEPLKRLVLGNLALLAGILWFTNSCSSAILDLQYVFEPYFISEDERASLPNYSDREQAAAMYREFDLLHTEYKPYYGWRRKPFAGRYTTVDEQGDRVHAPTTETPSGVVRFFGGSTLWGTGSGNEDTLPAHFNALFPELRVHNHGESGYVSRQNLERLQSLSNEGEAMDLVVFYDGYNDVRSLCRFDVSMQGHTRENKIREALRPSKHFVGSFTRATVEVLSFLWPKAKDAPGHPSRCHRDAERPERVIRTLLGNWQAAREIARLGGADFVAVLQPVAAVSSGRTDRLVNDASFKGKAHELVYPGLRRAIADAGEDWILDESRLFDRDEYIFVDAAHVSPNGNRLMAERLAEHLGPRLSSVQRPSHDQ